MIIIGELINTSREGLEEAVKNRDVEFIQDLAKQQEEAGADYIDVNCGTLLKEEVEAMEWLVKTVQEVVDVPLCIDSPNPKALKRGLEVHEGKALVNSISAEEDRFTETLEILKEHDARVVALTMDDEGMPKSAEDRIRVGKKLIEDLTAAGIAEADIFVDPIINPIGTDQQVGQYILDAIAEIANEYSDVHITCGLSNISHGLPQRHLLNRTFVTLAMGRGLDSAIIDPLDPKIMALVTAAETLLGHDQYCANYIQASKSGKLDV
ncbi:methyltetrahydrofolate cobalamin methyltransferase [Natroniella sulfidigena]|uniref:methyltetrahydrofolate cobalamin methyltransferase n=1 Tax=Natroniella sulfidigena TaxID=723921 RepID=UPI00200AC228|nr:methyltetrahydrofolate cobalamin methyltransferase [Natroniella sulfidigena]MCK8817233.1 methyltetrahydrofolate cobalamin methyltransferase [Natroniella sulfidigena]